MMRSFFLIMLFRTVQRVNSQINRHLAPESPNGRKLSSRVLSQLDFDRGLHLGSGRDKHGLGAKLETDGEIIALDPDIDGLKQNEMKKKVIADGQRLPFSDEEFDLVFSKHVFEHLPNPQSALEEIDRVLQPGGSFIVLVPNPGHYYARISDSTPFKFHKFWLRLQGRRNIEQDVFPTQYKWGRYSDVTEPDFDWEIEEFHSFSGPTGYTKILPIHILFVLLARRRADQPQHHVAYLVHYTV